MASSLIDPVARVGFAARGAVYAIIGVLAARAAAGTGGRTTGTAGAVREVGRLDATGVLLFLLAAGLLGYAAWRFAQAIADIDHKGNGLKGLAVRVGDAGSGLAYVGMALAAGGFGVARRQASHPLRAFVARWLAEPWGAWAVGLGGAVVVGVGVYQFYKAWATKFEDHLRLDQMSADERLWFRRIGRFGLSARGVTFLVIGWFLVRAAHYLNAREVKDVGGALRILQVQEFGAWLLGIVACGLVAYGLLSFIEARYRRIA
jgi:hypothetical protein